MPTNHIQNFISKECKTLVIVPSPKSADRTRGLLSSHFGANSNVDVITVSFFVQKLFEKFELDEKVEKKSEQILKLATGYKKLAKEALFNRFMQAYKLITELQAITAHSNVLKDALDFYDVSLKEDCELLWKIKEALSLVDEAESYKILTNHIKDKRDLIEWDEIHLWDFDHVNGCQIDLFKELGLFSDVKVFVNPCFSSVQQKTDWYYWLQPDFQFDEQRRSEQTELNFNALKSYNSSIADLICQLREDKRLRSDVVLGLPELSYEAVQELPLREYFFRSEVDLLSSEIETQFKEISRQNWKSEDLLSHLQERKSHYVKKKNFKALKVNLALHDGVVAYQELSSGNEDLELFDFNVLRTYMALENPRVYQMPVGSDDKRIMDLREGLERESESLLIWKKNYPDVSTSTDETPDQALNFLSTLGPIYNSRFRLEKIKSDLIAYSYKNSNKIYLEDGLLEESEFWRDLVGPKSLSVLEIDKGRRDGPPPYDPTSLLKKFGKTIDSEYLSPSRLQTYMDCPRLYHITYRDPLEKRPEIENNITPQAQGQILHEVIEKYVSSHDNYFKESFEMTCQDVIQHYISQNSKLITSNDLKRIKLEVIYNTSWVIQWLYDLRKTFGEAKFTFEKKMIWKNIKGYSDLIIETPLKSMVIDFKRGRFSIPTYSEILNFDKIQIWAYLLAEKSEKIKGFGYLCLSDPSSSRLLGDVDSFHKEFKFKPLKEELSELLSSVAETFTRVIETLENDTEFSPKPKNEAVCLYCPLKFSCSRGEDYANS